MAYWGGAGMNFVGGAMTERAKHIARAKRIVLATPEGKAMVNQALLELGSTPIGPRKGKRGPRASTIPKPPKNQGVYKSGPRKGEAKTRTAKQIAATADLVASNYEKFGVRRRAKEFGMRGRNNQTPLYI